MVMSLPFAFHSVLHPPAVSPRWNAEHTIVARTATPCLVRPSTSNRAPLPCRVTRTVPLPIRSAPAMVWITAPWVPSRNENVNWLEASDLVPRRISRLKRHCGLSGGTRWPNQGYMRTKYARVLVGVAFSSTPHFASTRPVVVVLPNDIDTSVIGTILSGAPRLTGGPRWESDGRGMPIATANPSKTDARRKPCIIGSSYFDVNLNMARPTACATPPPASPAPCNTPPPSSDTPPAHRTSRRAAACQSDHLPWR